MKKLKQFVKTGDYIFPILILYIIELILLPKKYSEFFGIPIRLASTILIIFLLVYGIRIKKFEANNKKNKLLYIIPILFIISVLPSVFVSKAPIKSIYTIIKFASYFMLFNVLYKIKFTKRQGIVITRIFIFCISILSIIGILQYIFGIDIMIKNSGVNYYPGAKGRVITTFFNTIYYGIFINIVFLPLMYLLIKSNNKKSSILLIILCSFLYINLLLTFTRSAILIFSAVLLLFIIVFYKSIIKPKFLIFLSIIIISTIIIPGGKPLILKSFDDALILSTKVTKFLPFDIINTNKKQEYMDYDENSEFVDYSLQHRESFAKIAKEIGNDNIYTGVGFGTYIEYMNSEDFARNYPEYTLAKTHPHSSLVLMYSETGIFGLITLVLLFIVVLLEIIKLSIKTYKNNKEAFNIAFISFLITIGYIIVNIISENAIYDTQVTYILIVVLTLLINKSKEKIVNT